MFLLALAIGAVAGLRALTPPAVVCWAASWNWILILDSRLSFVDSTITALIFTSLAIGELIADKMPWIGPRTRPGPLVDRMIMGGLSGAVLCQAGAESMWIGALLGAIGAVAGAYTGFIVRRGLVLKVKLADGAVALAEDAIAIAAAFVIVSAFA